MQAIVVPEPGKVAVEQRVVGNPREGEVRIRLLQGGYCGSDLAAFLGTSPLVVYPRVIGHELVGRVVAAGAGAEQLIDTVVVVEPMLPCGHCYACRRGRYNTCSSLAVMGVHVDGGFQTEFVVPSRNVHRVPADMDVDTATLAEPLTIACQAIWRAHVEAGEKVMIFGAGPIGLLALQVVTSYLGADALVVDVRDDRLQLAAQLGASETVNVGGWSGSGTSPDLLACVRDWSGGDGSHVVIEATGHPASTTAAIDCLAHAGRISLVGWNKGPITVDTVQLMRKEADVYGSRNSCRMFPRALDILVGGHIQVAKMISHKYDFSTYQEAFRVMCDPNSGAVKVALVP